MKLLDAITRWMRHRLDDDNDDEGRRAREAREREMATRRVRALQAQVAVMRARDIEEHRDAGDRPGY